jgi:mannose/fructose/N-acetylgalactosamine-specific phosphotransferase system component IID
MNMEDMLTSIVLVSVGIFILVVRKRLVESAYESGHAFCSKLGIPEMPEKFQKRASEIIGIFIGGTFVLLGLIQFVAIFTGRKFLE